MKKYSLLIKSLFALFVLYGITGLFILPNIIKKQIVLNLEPVIGRKVSLESVSVNPFTFEVGLYDLAVLGKKGEPAFGGVREISVNVDPLNLVLGELKIKSIEIISPFIRIHKDCNGEFNFSDLLLTEEKDVEANEAKKIELPALVLERFTVKSGKISFLDDTGYYPFEETIKPIDFTLRDFSTTKDHDNRLALHIVLDDGAEIDYLGTIDSIEPLRLRGSVKLHSGRIYTQWDYFRDDLGFIVADGGLNASMDYTADLSSKPMQVNINQYQVKIDSLRLQDKATKEDVLKLPSLEIYGDADLASKHLGVSSFTVKGLSLKGFRDKDGVINWASYFPGSELVKEESVTEPWHIDIAKVDIKTDEISFEEYFAPQAYRTGLENISVMVDGVSLDGETLHVKNFATLFSGFDLNTLPQKQQYLGFKSLGIEGSLGKVKSTDLNISQINLAGLEIFASMDKRGGINFSDLLAPKEKQPEEKKNDTLINWEVKKFRVSDSKVAFKDSLNAEDALTTIGDISLDMQGLSSIKGSWASTGLSAMINKTGILKIDSKLRQSPLKVTSDIRLTGLDLTGFQAYMDKKANIDMNSARLDLDLKAEHQNKATRLRANVLMKDLNLSERKEGKTFFAFSKLQVKEIEMGLNPDKMKIADIDIYGPYARMKVDKNGSTNLDRLMRTQESNDLATEEQEKVFPVFVGKVNFKEGKGEFSDLSLPLPFKTDIHDLNGQMLALGNFSEIKTKIDIDGVVDEYGLAKIEGSLLSANPKAFTDIQVKFQNIDMTNLSPYTGKFIGYKLKDGKMNVELKYKINDSQMQGENKTILKKLTLGDEVESEDAITAPVGLAIALLKDSEGVIDLDVPVSGDVDKPDFAIGHVVWTAFKNLIVGVATAPFRFLGDMLGISAEELENIQFEAGKANLLPPEREKLDKLAEVFSSKEMLILKVAGSYDKNRDLLAMQTASLYEEALIKLEDNTTDIFKMERGELNTLLEEMYIEHFGKEKLDALQDNSAETDEEKMKSGLLEAMKKALLDDQKISSEDLVALSDKRAKSIMKQMSLRGVSPDRLTLLKPVSVEMEQGENEYIPTKLELGSK